MILDTFSRFTELGSERKRKKTQKYCQRQYHMRNECWWVIYQASEKVEFCKYWNFHLYISAVTRLQRHTFQGCFQQHLCVHVKWLDPVVVSRAFHSKWCQITPQEHCENQTMLLMQGFTNVPTDWGSVIILGTKGITDGDHRTICLTTITARFCAVIKLLPTAHWRGGDMRDYTCKLGSTRSPDTPNQHILENKAFTLN